LLVLHTAGAGFSPSYPTPAVFCARRYARFVGAPFTFDYDCRVPWTDKLLQDAVALHQQGDVDRAGAIYQKILDAEPHNPNALNLLGMIHHQRGENETAEKLIRRAIEIAPTVPGFHNNLGNVLLAQRRMEPAEQAYRTAAQLQPDYAEAHNNLGVALL
jgi:Flp pilus assembly protein TadD